MADHPMHPDGYPHLTGNPDSAPRRPSHGTRIPTKSAPASSVPIRVSSTGYSATGAERELGASRDYGRIEYAYPLMAHAAGIDMALCRLLEDGGRAHFMTRHFDRVIDAGGKTVKHHMRSPQLSPAPPIDVMFALQHSDPALGGPAVKACAVAFGGDSQVPRGHSLRSPPGRAVEGRIAAGPPAVRSQPCPVAGCSLTATGRTSMLYGSPPPAEPLRACNTRVALSW